MPTVVAAAVLGGRTFDEATRCPSAAEDSGSYDASLQTTVLNYAMSLGKPPRLDWIFQKYDPPLFFVTLCPRNRRGILANNIVHQTLVAYGNGGVARGTALGRYVIMPDHIHLFVAGSRDFNLGIWVRGLKRVVAAAVLGGRGGSASLAEDVCRRGRTAATTTASARALSSAPSIWQRGFFDHLIRNSESYEQKWNYVRENPARAGLATEDNEWPFQGEIVRIDHA